MNYTHKNVTPVQYIKDYIKKVENYYGAHAEKRCAKALECLLGGNQINSHNITDAAEALGWKEEYYSIFENEK